jgi:hypothetical protein
MDTKEGDEPRQNSVQGTCAPGIYEVRVAGQLNARWSAWFDGLELSEMAGTTCIRGTVADQAALHGLLQKVRDLGLELVSVTRLQSGEHL